MTKVPLTANNSTPPTQAHQDAAPYPIRGDPDPLPCAAPMPQRLRHHSTLARHNLIPGGLSPHLSSVSACLAPGVPVSDLPAFSTAGDLAFTITERNTARTHANTCILVLPKERSFSELVLLLLF